MAGENDERHSRRLIFRRRVEDRHLFAGAGHCSVEFRDAAFDSRNHQILDADIGERSAGHDKIVAAARAVAVEVFSLDAARDQVFARRRRLP